MAFYRSLLSRLFGEEPEEKAAAPAEQAPPPEPEPPPPSRELQLAPDHAVHQLWEMRVGEKGWLSKPLLRLEERPDLPPVLTGNEPQQELLRLQMTVNSTANERLRQIQRRDGESSPPDLDAHVVAFISANGLAAWLMAYPPEIGRAHV